MNWLVVYPSVTNAILERRATLDLPSIPIKDLEYGMDEVMQIVNLLDAKLLSGKQATIHGLLDILAQGWDGIWIISHAEEEGWYLSDGIVNASETTALIRSSGTILLVMNTCSSYEVARKVSKELEVPVICTIKEVPDRQAFITGVIFAQKLASGFDYETAYGLAKPGQNSTYELITVDKPMNPNDRGRSSQNSTPDAQAFQKFAESVAELERIVYGSSRLGLAPLRELTVNLQKDVSKLDAKMVEMQNKLMEIQKAQQDRNRIFFVMTFVIVALLVSVGLLVFRGS